jgi:hypothetical protein
MSQKLKEALLELDPDNDEHWTEQGLPAMSAIHSITGDETISRKMVTDVAPKFNRMSALQAANFEAETTAVKSKAESAPIDTAVSDDEVLADLEATFKGYLDEGMARADAAAKVLRFGETMVTQARNFAAGVFAEQNQTIKQADLVHCNKKFAEVIQRDQNLSAEKKLEAMKADLERRAGPPKHPPLFDAGGE